MWDSFMVQETRKGSKGQGALGKLCYQMLRSTAAVESVTVLSLRRCLSLLCL